MLHDTGSRLETAPSHLQTHPIPASDAGTGIAGAVEFALDALADPREPQAAVTDGRLEGMLRAAAGWGRPRLPGQDDPAVGRAAIAVRVACAYLAAADHREARLALFAALDHLGPHRSAAAPDPFGDQRRPRRGRDAFPTTSATPSRPAA